MVEADPGQRAGASGCLVVIGSGLAGLAAALEAARAAPGLEVLVLEKNAHVGGNSAKASSGINAVNGAAGDSAAVFAGDTLRSGGGLSDAKLVEVLAASSEDALQFLTSLGLDLSSVVRLGGHSVPRTRSNPSGPNVGFALIRAVEAAVRRQPNVRIATGATVTSLAYSGDGRLAVSYTATTPAPEPGGSSHREAVTALAEAVVLASGGFAASRELLARYRPDVAALPTTNGPWATGDGIALGGALGAALVQMDQVQVHPTGFVDPKDPACGTKFLAPEKLRGCGALLLDASGRRFVDELATRDVVAAAITAQPGRGAWLLLGSEGAALFGEATLGFYCSKGLVSKFDDAAAAAQHMGVEAQQLLGELQRYKAAADAAAAAAAAAAPAAAPAPDEAAAGPGSSASPSSFNPTGKRYFPSRVGGASPVWVARVTPVVHYCMGGLAVAPDAAVLSKDGAPLPRLWAAGEVAGGLHGRNRLGGNSLAECAVFGRIAGRAAAKAALGAANPADAEAPRVRQPVPL